MNHPCRVRRLSLAAARLAAAAGAALGDAPPNMRESWHPAVVAPTRVARAGVSDSAPGARPAGASNTGGPRRRGAGRSSRGVPAGVLAACADRATRDPATRLFGPTSLAVDGRGALYVANAWDSSVVAYAPGARGAAPPARVLVASGGVPTPGGSHALPHGLALDARGRLVLTRSAPAGQEGGGSVTVYAPGAGGNAAPLRTITGTASEPIVPGGVAVGPGGAVYVVRGDEHTVLAYAPGADGAAAPARRMDIRGAIVTPPYQRIEPTAVAAGSDGTVYVTSGAPYPLGGALLAYRPERTESGPAPADPARGAADSVARRPPERTVLGARAGLASLRGPAGVAIDARGYAFVANGPFGFASAAVAVYAPDARGDAAPVRTISGPAAALGVPTAVAVDGRGALYVAHFADTVTVYAPGAAGDVAPARTIAGPHTGLRSPVGVAVDRDGYVYVANDSTGAPVERGSGRVTIYAPGAAGDAAPVRVLAGAATGLSRPAGLAVADDGTLYVANRTRSYDDLGGVAVLAAAGADDGDTGRGAAPVVRALAGAAARLTLPSAVALDPADTLYVLNASLPPSISVFAPLGTRPNAAGAAARLARTLGGGETGLASPTAVALAPGGALYVADAGGEPGLVRCRRGRTPRGRSGPPCRERRDRGAVRVYAPGAAGDAGPLRVLGGPGAGIDGPSALAVDRRGALYVANGKGGPPAPTPDRRAGSVTVYARGGAGGGRPTRTLAGVRTGLCEPSAVALGPGDTLYVANFRNSTVTVYAPGARDDTGPVRTLGAPSQPSAR